MTTLWNDAIHAGHEFSANSEVEALTALRTVGASLARDLAAGSGMTRAGTTNMIVLITGPLRERAGDR